MADSVDIAVSILSIVAAASASVSALISSAYNLRSELEKLSVLLNSNQEQLDSLASKVGHLVGEIDSTLHWCQANLHALEAEHGKFVEDWTQECRGSSISPQCLQLAAWHCQTLHHHKHIFWRMQSWITKHLNVLPNSLKAITEPLKQPSARALLLSWIVLAIATTAYYRTRFGRQHRIRFLLGSVFVASVIGISECTDIPTIILTDIPWCLTTGMLLHGLVYGVGRTCKDDLTRSWAFEYREMSLQDVEKAAVMVTSTQVDERTC